MNRKILCILSVTMLFVMTACGGTKAETTNKDIQQSTEQNSVEQNVVEESETTESSTIDTSNSFIIYEVDDSMTGYIINGVEISEINEEVITINDTQVVGQSGYPIGYIPAGTTIILTGRGPINGSGSGLRQILNPVSGTEDKYLYLSAGDVATEEEIAAMESSIEESLWAVAGNYEDRSIWGWKLSESSEEFNDILLQYESSVLSNIDAEKTYTKDEIQELFIKIIEENGLTWNPALGDVSTKSYHDEQIFWGDIELSKNGAGLQEDVFQILAGARWTVLSLEFHQLYYRVDAEEDETLSIMLLQKE